MAIRKLACAAAASIILVTAVGPLGAEPWEAFDVFLTPYIFEEPYDSFGSQLAVGDYNGDGNADFAAFGYNTEGGLAAGGLLVMQGRNPHYVCCADFLEGASEQLYGEGLAFGDFDGNGADELAAGRPGRTVSGAAKAGDLVVQRPTPGGGGTWDTLATWSQGSAGIIGGVEAGDYFGRTLAAGDFNNDGVDDLAVAAPREAVGSIADAGAVNVLYGAEGIGLTATGNQQFHEDSTGVPGSAEADDLFGIVLATGDVTCDGIDDLIVGIPSEDIGSAAAAGAILVLPGSASGLTTNGSFVMDQSDFGGALEAEDRFGSEIVVARLNDEPAGCATLVVGAPNEDVGDQENAGAIFLYRNGAEAIWTQADVGASDEAHDLFGRGLAAGDFDHDGHEELAIGAPGEDRNGSDYTGTIFVARTDGSSLDALPAHQIWMRRGLVGDTAGGGGYYDHTFFGAVLAAADLDGDGYDDLVVAAPQTDSGPTVDSGGVTVLFSSLFSEDFEGNDLAEWTSTSP